MRSLPLPREAFWPVEMMAEISPFHLAAFSNKLLISHTANRKNWRIVQNMKRAA